MPAQRAVMATAPATTAVMVITCLVVSPLPGNTGKPCGAGPGAGAGAGVGSAGTELDGARIHFRRLTCIGNHQGAGFTGDNNIIVEARDLVGRSLVLGSHGDLRGLCRQAVGGADRCRALHHVYASALVTHRGIGVDRYLRTVGAHRSGGSRRLFQSCRRWRRRPSGLLPCRSALRCPTHRAWCCRSQP